MKARHGLAGLALLAMAAAAPIPALAETVSVVGDKVKSVPVRYSGRSLADEAAAKDLLARLEQAAYDACGGDPRRHSSYRFTPDLTKSVFRKCQDDAVARAVAQVGSPKLAALHAGGRTVADRAR